jgi:hypothetical protein
VKHLDAAPFCYRDHFCVACDERKPVYLGNGEKDMVAGLDVRDGRHSVAKNEIMVDVDKLNGVVHLPLEGRANEATLIRELLEGALDLKPSVGRHGDWAALGT